MKMLPSLILSSFLFLPAVFAASAEDWKSRSIYQVVVDRFALANDSGAACDTTQRQYCGGSWQGIENHLDYIQNMGFDAIWVSPIVENVQGETAYGEAYHGYWPAKLDSLNTNFGSEDDFNSLISALHSKSMYIMVDFVVNHLVAVPTNTTDVSPQTFDYSTLTFSDVIDYHAQCFIDDYNNQTDVEQCWLGDVSLPLLDLNTENDTTVAYMYNWIKSTVSTYDIDGIRIDTVKHIRSDFWPDFATNAGVFTLGEVLINNVSYATTYTNVLDAILDYPTWFALYAAFNTTSGSMSGLVNTVKDSQSEYKNGEIMTGSFLENHDQVRFQSLTTDTGLVKNAVSWPFIQDGIPILYYGQEQGYTGGADPNNREALWLSGYDEDKDLVEQIKNLNLARKSAAAYNSAFLNTSLTFLDQSDESCIAVSKPPILALLTNTGANGSASWTVDSSSNLFSSGETIVDILTCNTLTADSSGGLTATATSGAPLILMPATALSTAGSLCTSAATGSGSSSSSSGSSGALPLKISLTAAASIVALTFFGVIGL